MVPERQVCGEAFTVRDGNDTIALAVRIGEGLDPRMAWLAAIQQKLRHRAAAAIQCQAIGFR